MVVRSKKAIKKKPVKKKGSKKKTKKRVVTGVGRLRPVSISLKSLTQEQRKEEHRLYMRVWRLKKKINKLNAEKPKGYRSQRSLLYKDLVKLNVGYKSFWTKLGGKYEKLTDTTGDLPTGLVSRGVKSYIMTVWTFEGYLRDFLNNATFNYYYFVNIEKTYNFKLHFKTTILFAWDDVLDAAYSNGGTTPRVYVTEDYNKGKITIQVYF